MNRGFGVVGDKNLRFWTEDSRREEYEELLGVCRIFEIGIRGGKVEERHWTKLSWTEPEDEVKFTRIKMELKRRQIIRICSMFLLFSFTIPFLAIDANMLCLYVGIDCFVNFKIAPQFDIFALSLFF